MMKFVLGFEKSLRVEDSIVSTQIESSTTRQQLAFPLVGSAAEVGMETVYLPMSLIVVLLDFED